ncbi:PGF-pre-PGF domain-containing protein [Candidatus Woesearchaeota archaeon]|nr:PGF-pre-PGF domain-containing protein [Candidatus Woesearchaeota archaeon]
MKYKPIINIVLFLLVLEVITAQPFPLGIDGFVYFRDGMTPVSNDVNFSVNNTNNGFYIQGAAGKIIPGRYSVAIRGEQGDLIEIRAWNNITAASQFITVEGSLHDINLILDMDIPNYAPEIISEPVLTAYEDQLYEYNVVADDNNNDPLSYELMAYPENMSINEYGLITWIPSDAQVGTHFIKINVSDGELSALQEYYLGVINVNDAPEIISIPVMTADIGFLYSYDVDALDIDSGNLTYELIKKPESMTINSLNGMISWIPGISEVGENEVVVRVSDDFLSDEQNFTIIVNSPQNQDPKITSSPITSVNEGSSYEYDVQAYDPENDTLTYSLVYMPEGMQINNETGLITWMPGNDDIGEHYVLISVADQRGGTAVQDFELEVLNINNPPEIISKPVTFGFVFIPYFYRVKAKDEDGDKLRFSLIESPEKMRISSRTGWIIWIPRIPGKYDVIVEVTDGELSDLQYFSINISSLWNIRHRLQNAYFFGQPETGINEQVLTVTNIDSPVTEIIFDNDEEIPEIYIESMQSLPVKYTGKIQSFVYSYVNITEINEKNIRLRFKIEKSWLDKYMIFENTIVLKKFENNKWTDQETGFVKQDKDYSYFESASSGLGLFAVSTSMDPVDIQSRLNAMPLEEDKILKKPFFIYGNIYFSDGSLVPEEFDVQVEEHDINIKTGMLSVSGAYSMVVNSKKNDEITLSIGKDNFRQNFFITLVDSEIQRDITLDLTKEQFNSILYRKSLFKIVTKIFIVLLIISATGVLLLFFKNKIRYKKAKHKKPKK